MPIIKIKPTPLPNVQDKARAKIIAARDAEITGGFAYLGKTIDSDRADKRITDTVDDGTAAARRALSNSLMACNICHWCESPVGTGRV